MLLERNLHPHPPMLFHTYKLFFRCEIVGGTAQTSLETSQVAFFGRDGIPADLSIQRVLPAQIKQLFAYHDDPTRPPIIN